MVNETVEIETQLEAGDSQIKNNRECVYLGRQLTWENKCNK